MLLGQVDAQPAQLRHLLPERGARLGVGLEQRAVGREGAVRREHAAHRGPELLVLVGDGDRHSCPLASCRPGPEPAPTGARHYRTPVRPLQAEAVRWSGEVESPTCPAAAHRAALFRHRHRRPAHPGALHVHSRCRIAGGPRRPPPASRPRRPHRARATSRCRSGRPPVWESSAPTGSASRRSCRSWRGSSSPPQVTSGSIHPPPTVGYLAQEHVTDGDETVRAALYRRTGVAAAEEELTAARVVPGGRRVTHGRPLRDRPRPVRGDRGRRLRVRAS